MIEENQSLDLESLICVIPNYKTEISHLVKQFSNLWEESFRHKLLKEFREPKAIIEFEKYKNIFPLEYRQKFSAEDAFTDLLQLQISLDEAKTVFKFSAIDNLVFTLKIYSPQKKLTLSETLPFIESLGFIAVEEQSFAINSTDIIEQSWIHLFVLNTVLSINTDLKKLCDNVENILDKMKQNRLSVDSLSNLVVLCGFSWQEVRLLKGLTRYLSQTSFVYNSEYIQATLVKHYEYAKLVINLFDAKFNPIHEERQDLNNIHQSIDKYLDTITNSAEDKVLRAIVNLCDAMVRTNYYQNIDGNVKNYVSFKFNSKKITSLPRPIPYAEIFVYSYEFEGVHLRGGKVARGGIRWSDRSEDYRVEVLGLMKAQMTKNPVIVPVGSKGGFVINFTQDGLSRDEYMARVVSCYKDFLRGLLDITDNIVESEVQSPLDTIIYDDKDPYLVVAADKGTATFSDFANSVSAEYNYWLRDAFASGGSRGYDHKKMGITAKGAWISVQNHFKEMAIDVQTDSITVVGIGDMSGDIFGNGMLLSKEIKLVAAFNHIHIFIDPNPETNSSFSERQRLFNLPSSKWSDYDKALISKGGGVFERSAKLITISPEIQVLLDIRSNAMEPEALIKSILMANVDLIWNGGIGTYIKSSLESNSEIGDRANDALRCNGNEIRAKVIAEGGNLGVSQNGRVEYARCGGRINTDFIDNSAGVDCSDHEVNIKIVLNNAIAKSTLTMVERDELLVQMTNQVAKLVLFDNYKQTQAILIAQSPQAENITISSQLIKTLEECGILDRVVEFLPDEKELQRRTTSGERLTGPEQAVLLSYSKMFVNKELHKATLIEEAYFERWLIDYFPKIMQERFREEILNHPLRNEIIKTIVTNKIVNQLGGAMINTIKRETGGKTCDIIRSYIIVSQIFGLDPLWELVESLSTNVSSEIRIEMFAELAKIMRRGTAWFIRNLEHPVTIQQTIEQFFEPTKYLTKIIPSLLVGDAKNKFNDKIEKYTNVKISLHVAESIAALDSLVSVFDILHVAERTKIDANLVAQLYFAVGDKFHIDWLRKLCDSQIENSYWSKLSIQSIKDDLYDKQRRLLIKIVGNVTTLEELNAWISHNQCAVDIFFTFVEKIQLQDTTNLHMMILANKKFELFLRKLG